MVKDIRVERTSERLKSRNDGRQLRTDDAFWMEGSSRMARSGEDSGLDAESCEFLEGNSWWLGHVLSS